MTKTQYSFPNRQNRNAFLKLLDMRVGEYGLGLGLEFEGLEFALERNEARGDLVSHVPPKAKGKWHMNGNEVIIEWDFIANHRDSFEKLRDRVWETAGTFGA